ncbi:MAG: diguanylate cyclase [Arcobacteraceae bacterium]|jgi:diguanylate cyclase (GGDEF)-like protein|nr:diguanylate cyclase [Arcobacteraceae bacterium]
MKNILIIEENKTIANLLAQEIRYKIENINVLISHSYEEVLKYIFDKDTKIDFAILDLNFPDAKDGEIVKLTLAKNIRSIIYSASFNQDLILDILQDGIITYIEKGGNKSINTVIRHLQTALKTDETNILIVDNSIAQPSILKSMIEEIGFNVYTAKDGSEAYDFVENNPQIKFSLVLTHFNMPNIDGIELTLKLRKKYTIEELGIIVLSASDMEDISTKFLKIGANDFINKPYRKIEIKTKINTVLENLSLFEEIRDMANKDFLTGAYNRRFFYDSGTAIFLKAKREKRDLCVAMFDIDKFKNINDTHGHDIGDVAIKEVATILHQTLRKSDLIARFGGEEFCVLLENISREDAITLFEKIRDIFEKNILNVNNIEVRFTVSIGIFYGIQETIDDMIKIADNGLYFCKEHGRNQVAINKID